MNGWLVQIKREFWEHQTAFVITPAIIAVLVVTVFTYIAVMHAATDSKVGMGLYGDVYYYDSSLIHAGEQAAGDTGGTGDSDESREHVTEYIIDFTKGELVEAKDGDSSRSLGEYREYRIKSVLHGFHSMFIFIFGFVLMFYLLSCLYTDRKDRSILYWKSLPVSEDRNVVTKLIVATFAVPILVTMVSWVVQLCYLVSSTIFIYRIGISPWDVVWPQAELLSIFFEQLKYSLWIMLWWLPLNAWLLFSSALAKRSPFLVATIPVGVIIIMEKLLFGTWNIGMLFVGHLRGIQIQNLSGDAFDGATSGSIDLTLGSIEMLAGFVIAGLLFPAIVWLRNHRFEI